MRGEPHNHEARESAADKPSPPSLPRQREEFMANRPQMRFATIVQELARKVIEDRCRKECERPHRPDIFHWRTGHDQASQMRIDFASAFAGEM